jgi:hypothetical protein
VIAGEGDRRSAELSARRQQACREKTMLLFAPGCPLGGLQRVDPDFNDVDFRFRVGCKVANAQSPFCPRIRVGVTKFTVIRFNNSFASFAFFDNREERTFAEFCRITCLHMPTPEKI